MPSSVAQLHRVAIAVTAHRAAAELDGQVVLVERDAVDAERRLAATLVEERGLVRGQEDRLERLAGTGRAAAVGAHERVVQANRREVDRFEPRKARGWQVARLDDERIRAGEPEPPQRDD